MGNGVSDEADCNIDPKTGLMPVMGNYAKGSTPFLVKDCGDKDDKDLASGLQLKTSYAEAGEGPKDVKFQLVANAVAVISDKHKAFLDCLRSSEILAVKPRERFRWAATQAGFSENTNISTITKPITKEITDLAERMIMEASISAAWVLQDTVDGENIETVTTKIKLDAAKEILDRAVPKKEAKALVHQGPLVQIMLPPKALRIVEVVDEENIPSD